MKGSSRTAALAEADVFPYSSTTTIQLKMDQVTVHPRLKCATPKLKITFAYLGNLQLQPEVFIHGKAESFVQGFHLEWRHYDERRPQ